MTAQSCAPVPAEPAGRDPAGDGLVIEKSLHDPEQFAVIFRRHAPDVQRYVVRRLGAGAAEDVPASEGGGKDEIIINPRTFHQMGTELLATAPAGSRGEVLSGTAILRKVLVSGPGVLP